ncbi:hypothetical protein [Ulvibacterium sp.]|uniref:hypothetical protein n=1 Tax=Ulvibacterium sp. TaxID=2665914 RepID=UPI00262E9CDF|nr:hypothetical protein [Ulvibacterium sp.]
MQRILVLSALLFVRVTWGQSDTNTVFDYGVAIKLEFEMQRDINFKLSTVGGIGRKIDDIEFIYPSFHVELQIFNSGFGTSLIQAKHRNFVFDVLTSFQVSTGIREINEVQRENRFNPLFHFSNLSATPLHNPYFNSIGLGSVFIISSDNKRESQLVGTLYLNIERTVQFTYYNDGPPFANWLSDGFDRYYTGGAHVSFHTDTKNYLSQYELSYHKFTGYQRFAFEMANHLQIDFIPYSDQEAFYYNQSRWRFKAANPENGYGILISKYDMQHWDIQDLIHFSRNNSYHPDTYRNNRLGIGLDYNFIKNYRE